MLTSHCLKLQLGNKKLELAITANDSQHAQAQALDIARALQTETFSLSYKKIEEVSLSCLFKRLAYSDFDTTECDDWPGKTCNSSPCFYVLGKRYYVRAVILRYLDIPREGVVPKPRCKNQNCINPYHFEYCAEKNTKLSGGDLQMLLAFQSQGASVRQIAKVLNVHRSTIYRKLKDERIHSGTSRHL